MLDGLSSFEQVMYIIAFASSGLFAVKLILSIIGVGGGLDALDADADVDAGDAGESTDLAVTEGLHFLTLNGLFGFLCVGSWTTIIAFSSNGSYILSSIFGFVAGLVMMVILAVMMRALGRMQESGNVQMPKAIGKLGEVYLTIPAHGNGEGKVNLEMGGALKEFQAISNDETPIETGSRVRVVDIENDDIVVVQRESEELV